MDQEHVVATAAAEELPALRRRVRERHPKASFLSALSTARRACSAPRLHDVWLDEDKGVLLVLEHVRKREGYGQKTVELLLHRLPLRSPACDPLLETLARNPLERLHDSRVGRDTFIGLPTALAALEQLFRVHLARLRLVHPGPVEVDRAIRDQVARAATPEQARRRTAFRDWHLREVCGWPEHLAPADAARAVRLSPGHLEGVVGAWHAYEDAAYDRPVIDRWWEEQGRGRKRRHRQLYYYEFRALDRPLTDRQVANLAKVLPEGDVDRDGAVVDVEVEPGEHDFRWVDVELLSAYFDAGLHFRQSGARSLWLRVPSGLADLVEPYRRPGVVGITDLGEDLLVELNRYEEDGEHAYRGTDPSPWLAGMAPVRDELARGDLRALHVAWTAADSLEGREPTPPPAPEPPGLADPTPGLAALRHFLAHVP